MISKKELKFIRSLKIKKYRTAEKCFLVEGEKNLLELLKADYKIKRLLLTKDFVGKFGDDVNLSYHIVNEKELAIASSLMTNDQGLAVVEMRTFSVNDLNLDNRIFVLDGIKDPGNLGTVIRTLDWFGFDQLVCSEETVDQFNPKVIGATMGSFTRVKMVYCDLIKFLQDYNGIKIGAEMRGDDIINFRKVNSCAIVLGSESHGISQPVRDLLDHSITIPKVGRAESLNVGVAAGILCHTLVIK